MPKKSSSAIDGAAFGVALAGADFLLDWGVFLAVFSTLLLFVFLEGFWVLMVDAANMSSKPPHSSCGEDVLAFGSAGAGPGEGAIGLVRETTLRLGSDGCPPSRF